MDAVKNPEGDGWGDAAWILWILRSAQNDSSLRWKFSHHKHLQSAQHLFTRGQVPRLGGATPTAQAQVCVARWFVQDENVRLLQHPAIGLHALLGEVPSYIHRSKFRVRLFSSRQAITGMYLSGSMQNA